MTAQNSQSEGPSIEKETRFAVVMYGGVSLAIYINGVAQELYKMVCATARTKNADGSFGGYFIKPEDLDGTEAVYRSLGEELRTRFVVDILSGTSAGGINAIFLAKALANHQAMAPLEKLWVEQGDINLLINDKTSLADIDKLQPGPHPTSLLNSRRMYYQLLNAFDGMDRSDPRSGEDVSPLVEELDLFVTATDIRGLWLPVPLADKDAHEYRYRTVFRFFHSTAETREDWSQDFLKENNPFLAFAARATSSFPFAFEPIKMKDVGEALAGASFVQNYKYMELKKSWSRFHKDYNRDPEQDGIERHSFGDGGYLDNKPFSYITETLLRRRADTPVDRRLFYIEPAPEHQRRDTLTEDDRPDALENVAAALVELPRYETIRDDLLVIKARNDLIERTNTILRQINSTRTGVAHLNVWESRGSDWSQKYLDEIINDYGAAYAAYHQLRVADTLDDFAAVVARKIGMEEEGKSFNLLRQICEEWRKRKYSSRSKQERRSENDLLYRLDLRWRVRRLFFMMRSIDDILVGLAAFRTDKTEPESSAEAREQREQAKEIVRSSGVTWKIADDEMENQYFEALAWIKRSLNNAYGELRVRGRKIRSRSLVSDDPDLKLYIEALQPLTPLKEQVEQVWKDANKLAKTCDDMETLSLSLASRPAKKNAPSTGYLHQTMKAVSDACQEALGIPDRTGKVPAPQQPLPDIPKAILKKAQDCLRFYYEHFEYFDMLTFPIMYATPIGESDVVDVYRISPEDATGLFDQKQNKHPKLAGTKLGNFGAFFKREWRENDILWGRLDGAERIISTLLPDTPKRTELLLKAWLAILKDNKLDPQNQQNISRSLREAWDAFEGAENPSVAQMTKLQKELRLYFEKGYAVDLSFSPPTTLNALGRSVQVLGSLLNGLGPKYQAAQTPGLFLTRLGNIFIGVMQVAIPGSLPRMFFLHWIKIMYVFELFLILVGGLLGFNNTVMRFGIVSLLATLSIDLAVRIVGNYLGGSTRAAVVLRGLAKIVVILVILGLLALVYLGLVQLGIAELPELKILGISLLPK